MRHTPQNEAGFSLIEVTVGMLLLMIGSLALAGGVAAGARRLTGSQDQLLASQRAAEAAESVFKARDNRTITWAQVRNVAPRLMPHVSFNTLATGARQLVVHDALLTIFSPAYFAWLTP